MNKITIDLDPLIEFLPKNHHMIEKIKQCEVDKPGTGKEAAKVRNLARYNPVVARCFAAHEFGDISYNDYLELAVVRLADQNGLLIKDLMRERASRQTSMPVENPSKF